jgi:hypothetical protein
MAKLWRDGDRMTEKKWLGNGAPSQPFQMLAYLREKGITRRKNGRRKLRLLACAACRRLGSLLTKELRELIDVAERLAEGVASKEELRAAVKAAESAQVLRQTYSELTASGAAHMTLRANAADAASLALRWAFNAYTRDPDTPGIADQQRWREIETFQNGLFREIFGNPFRPVALPEDGSTGQWAAAKHLAQTIYDERGFGDMPVLADALEEAGCDNRAVLEHCRSQKGHVPGCWVVDLLLGRG